MVLGLGVGDICATAVSMKSMKFNLHKLEAANYQKLRQREREGEREKKQEEKVAELFLVDLVLP